MHSHAKGPTSAHSSVYCLAIMGKAPCAPASAVNSHAGEVNILKWLVPVSSVYSILPGALTSTSLAAPASYADPHVPDSNVYSHVGADNAPSLLAPVSSIYPYRHANVAGADVPVPCVYSHGLAASQHFFSCFVSDF